MGSLFRKSEAHYCEHGMQQLTGGHVEAAARTFEQGLKRFPRSWSILSNRANLHIVNQDFQKAVKDLDQALALMPGDYQARRTVQLIRGTCHVHLDNNEQALEDLNSGIQDTTTPAPLLAKGYFYRALVHMDQDSRDQAVSDAEQALRLAPDQPRHAELVADLRQRQTSPTSPEINRLGQQGAGLLRAGEAHEALERFEAILRLEPSHAKALQLKAAALHQLQRYQEELEALNRSYALDENEVALFNRAMCHAALDNRQAAIYDLRAFIAVGKHQETVARARVLLESLSD